MAEYGECHYEGGVVRSEMCTKAYRGMRSAVRDYDCLLVKSSPSLAC